MSSFDKFRGRSSELVPQSNKGPKQAADIAAGVSQYLTPNKASVPDAVANALNGHQGRFVFCLDATGSMASLIEMAKSSLVEIARRISVEARCTVEMQFVAYRDYDTGPLIAEHSPLTDQIQAHLAFLNGVRATGGGARMGEAVQAALDRASRIDNLSGILLAGDEPAHSGAQLKALGKHNELTAEDWAREFGRRSVPIHTFVVGNYPETIESFTRIASLSGGETGFLDGTNAMIDMAVMAMLAGLKGREAVSQYMTHYQLSDNASNFGKLLIAAPEK